MYVFPLVRLQCLTEAALHSLRDLKASQGDDRVMRGCQVVSGPWIPHTWYLVGNIEGHSTNLMFEQLI